MGSEMCIRDSISSFALTDLPTDGNSIKTISPNVEIFSVDEAFIDLTSREITFSDNSKI